MSSFAWGALGALAVLFFLGAVRRAFWHRRLRRWRGRGTYALRVLSARLGARPEQERVLSAEARALAVEVHALRDDLFGARSELAELLAGPTLDAAAVAAALERRTEKLGQLRARLADALSRVHAALDPEQRLRLAEVLRHGPRGPSGHRWSHA